MENGGSSLTPTAANESLDGKVGLILTANANVADLRLPGSEQLSLGQMLDLDSESIGASANGASNNDYEDRQSCSNCGKLAHLGDEIYRCNHPECKHDLCIECFNEFELQVFTPDAKKPVLKDNHAVQVEMVRDDDLEKWIDVNTLNDGDLQKIVEGKKELSLRLNDKKGNRQNTLSGCWVIATACEENNRKIATECEGGSKKIPDDTPVSAKVSRWVPQIFSGAIEAAAILLPPINSLWPAMAEPKEATLSRPATDVGWGISAAAANKQGRRHVCINSTADDSGGGHKDLQIGDSIQTIITGQGHADIDTANLTGKEVNDLFSDSSDSLKDLTEVTVKFLRNSDNTVNVPMEMLRDAVQPKCAIVGIFKTVEDLRKAVDFAKQPQCQTTATCVPPRESPFNAEIKIAENASRFLVHPASGNDLNWFAAFQVGKGGLVESIPFLPLTTGVTKKENKRSNETSSTIAKPHFSNGLPFNIQISSHMKDIFVSQKLEKHKGQGQSKNWQDPNTKLSNAVSLNHDLTNQEAKYRPIDAFVVEAKTKQDVGLRLQRNPSKVSNVGSEKKDLDLSIVVALQNDGVSGMKPLGPRTFQDLRDSYLMLPGLLTQRINRGAVTSNSLKVTLIETRLSRNALLDEIGKYQHNGADLVLVPKSLVSLSDRPQQSWTIEENQRVGFTVADVAKDGYPVVSAVTPGSTAARRKLKVGDLVLEFRVLKPDKSFVFDGSEQSSEAIPELQDELNEKEKDAKRTVEIKVRSIDYASQTTPFGDAVDKECPGGLKVDWLGSKTESVSARLSKGAESSALLVSARALKLASDPTAEVEWAFRAETEIDCEHNGFEIGVITQKQVADMKALSKHGVTGFSEVEASVLPRPPLGYRFEGKHIAMKLKSNIASVMIGGASLVVEYTVDNMPPISQVVHLEDWQQDEGVFLAVTLFPGQTITFAPDMCATLESETIRAKDAEDITLGGKTSTVIGDKAQSTSIGSSSGVRTKENAPIRLGDKIVAVDGDFNFDAFTAPLATEDVAQKVSETTGLRSSNWLHEAIPREKAECEYAIQRSATLSLQWQHHSLYVRIRTRSC